jgi:hypothetical protein
MHRYQPEVRNVKIDISTPIPHYLDQRMIIRYNTCQLNQRKPKQVDFRYSQGGVVGIRSSSEGDQLSIG